jgi:hypothetical protein
MLMNSIFSYSTVHPSEFLQDVGPDLNERSYWVVLKPTTSRLSLETEDLRSGLSLIPDRPNNVSVSRCESQDYACWYFSAAKSGSFYSRY